MRKSRWVSMLLLLALLAACAAPAAAPAVEVGTATATTAADSEGTVLRTDWYDGYSTSTYPWPTICCIQLMDMIFNPLVTVEYDYKQAEIILHPELGLATNWDSQNDNREWTFHLREGVIWHDGNPFTSTDVKFTYEMLLNQAEVLKPEYPGWQASLLTELNIVDMVTTDDLTVSIKTEKPQERLPEKLSSIWILPAHLLEDANLEPGTESEFFTSQLVGTGAFKFVQHELDNFVALERNLDFFRGEPKVEKLLAVMRLQDDTRRVNALAAGDVDVISVTNGESGWHALDAYRESPDFLVTGYWAVNNRVQEILPLGNIGDLPSYHREEQWVITDDPPQTSQPLSPSPADRILENIAPLVPLLAQEQYNLTPDDFNFAASRGFPPDTEDFTQAGAPVLEFPAESIEELDNKILAIFYINKCVSETECPKTPLDMAIRIVKPDPEGKTALAQFLIWDESKQEEFVVQGVQAEVVDGWPPVDQPQSWFAIGNSHKYYIYGGKNKGIRICIPIPWH